MIIVPIEITPLKIASQWKPAIPTHLHTLSPRNKTFDIVVRVEVKRSGLDFALKYK